MSSNVWASGTEIQPVVRATDAADFTFESAAGPTYYLPITSFPEAEELFVDIDGLRQFVGENFGYVKAEHKITFSEALPTGLKVHVRVQASAVVNLPDQIADPTPFGNSLISQEDAAAARTLLGLGTASLRNVPASGNAAATEAVLGNDSRLADARTPLTHSHTTADISGSWDATRLSGTVPLANLPATAIERLVVVANQAARYALTTVQAQNGDTVKELDTGFLWAVVDDTQLTSAAGYVAYTAGAAASVSWAGVTDKPAALTGAGTATQFVAGNMTLQTAQLPIQFKDEGVNAGSSGGISSLDFVGAGVSSSLTGSSLTINIPGGGGGGSSLTPPATISTNTTLAANAIYKYTAAGLTLTLPASPANGDVVIIINAGTSVNGIAGRNGKTIMGLAENLTLDMPMKTYVLTYCSAETDWTLR